MSLLVLGVSITGSGCLMSKLLGSVASMRIVDTGIPNPAGTDRFLKGAISLGCTQDITDQGKNGKQLWVNCPEQTFVGVPGKLSFGFGENKANLTLGCDNGDRVHCDDPIKKVLEAGM